MEHLPGRIALVYDWVTKWGGAEKVLLALNRLFPQAPLYTSVYSASTAPWAKVFPQIVPSFLNKLPLAASFHELYPWLTPFAFETFDFRQYDAVISVTSADAKGIITPPSTFHLCYCLTPTRYLWSHKSDYRNKLSLLAKTFASPAYAYLSAWDKIAAQRPDAYVSISQTVHDRVLRYYHTPSEIVYPPVDTAAFSNPALPPQYEDYFLYVGRLVSYKHPQKIITAFNQLGHRLVVVGTGRCLNELKRMARSNITFTGLIEQNQLVSLYQHAKGLIFFHEEDFGLVPVEAMAAGIPVIALNRGGASETVVPGRTGILIDSDTPQALISAVQNFSSSNYQPQIIKAWAETFSQKNFSTKFVKVFTTAWRKHKNTYTS